MSEKQKIIRVFIGSPGGLDEERQAAHDAVNRVNRSHSDHWRLQFRLMGWETAIPGYARPQDKINQDLDKCDYFIGVLWNNWGSRPSTDPDGPTSGFEEEYKRAEVRINNGFMKDMAIYFKKVDVPAGLEPGENLRRVLQFREKCICDKKPFFKDFVDAQQFRDLIQEKLEEIGWLETEISLGEEHPSDLSKKPPPSQPQIDDQPSHNRWLLDEDVRVFINEMCKRPSDWESTSSYEVARLRLIGTALTRSGNDESYLGNHDANLMYEKFKNEELSKQEIRALVDCGVVGFQHQNVPLWTWLAREESEDGIWGRVKILAVFGSDAEKRQAINLLRLVQAPIPTIEDFVDRRRTLSIWLSDKSDTSVFDAALSFLASNASLDDLEIIEELSVQRSLFHRARIQEAIVGILARADPDSALKRVIDQEVDKIDTSIVETMFASPQSISTETASLCLSAKPENLRLRAVQILADRAEIKTGVADSLLTDSNHEIRLIAAESLIKNGVTLANDTAREALRVIKPSNPFLGILPKNQTDDTFYERYYANRLSELSLGELEEVVETIGIVNYREMSVLLSKYTKKYLSFIRENLADGFETYFEQRLGSHLRDKAPPENTERRLRELKPVILQRLSEAALQAITKFGDAKDLDLVRSTVSKIETDATESTISYFAHHGDWSDIHRIKQLGEHRKSGIGLLSMYSIKMPREKAAAILAIGKMRVADVLGLDLDDAIRISLVDLLPKTLIKSLKDEMLLRELANRSDEYRKRFALKCVLALPKSRLRMLLKRYMFNSGQRYYNVIHWLDLGEALPSGVAKSIAEQALKRT